MEKFKTIEDQLFSLVKGCINDKEFMTEPKPTDNHEWVNSRVGHQNIKTGVRLDYSTVTTLLIYEDGDSYSTKSQSKQTKIITLIFENEPTIRIAHKRVNELNNTVPVTKVVTREAKSNIGKFINLFRSKTYTQNSIEKRTEYMYKYELVCGEFNIFLTDEEVDELVKLYLTNMILFKKEKEVLEIEKRIKKYIK